MQPICCPAPDTSETALYADARALHAALSDLVRIYQYRDRDRICCHDISVTQCHALEALITGGPMRSQSLAAALRLDKSTTTRVIDALERKGYVERAVASDDARAVTLRATADGSALYERINSELVAQQAALLADLDPGLRAAATQVIRRLASAAQQRFAAGVSVGSCTTTCAPAAAAC